MMRGSLLIYFCFCCSIFCTTITAQEKVELFNDLEVIPALKTIHKTFDLKKGEDLVVTVTPMKGKLGKFIIDLPDSQFSLINKRIEKIDREVINITKQGTYEFHFVNTDPVVKEIEIKIYKQRSTIGKDTVFLDDVIFSSFRDTIRTYRDDTIPVPDISEYSFVLNPALNYGAVSDSCILEELLNDDKTEYQYAAYWVGIGPEALAEYEKLKNNPPASWMLAGVNEPLMAYGLGVTDLLPLSTSSISRDVMFKFMNPDEFNNTDKKPKLTRKDKRGDLFGRIPISSASKYKKLLLSIRNFNTTSSVPIYVKFVKFKLDRVYYNEYIIRERVQEIFREKTMQIPAPDTE